MGRYESPFKALPLPQGSKATKPSPGEGKDKGFEDQDCRGCRRRSGTTMYLQKRHHDSYDGSDPRVQ
jgi:hypothetical protein